MNKSNKIINILFFMLIFSGNLFAQSATELEGEFKLAPAIILIILLVTFIMVGFLTVQKIQRPIELQAEKFLLLVRVWLLHLTG